MEVQTFFLAKQIEKAGPGSNYNAQMVGAHNFYPLDGSFPLSFTMPYYMLLRRATRESDEMITLRFSLINLGGNNVGQPQKVTAKGVFPAKHKFMILTGTIKFLFPSPGDYFLEIVADEERLRSKFVYDIEVTTLQR